MLVSDEQLEDLPQTRARDPELAARASEVYADDRALPEPLRDVVAAVDPRRHQLRRGGDGAADPASGP